MAARRRHGRSDTPAGAPRRGVAEGAADSYPRFAPTMEWDIAAGHAIARYAGARVVRADNGEELVYNKEELLNPWFVVGR